MGNLDSLLSDLLLEAADKSETKLLLLVARKDQQAGLRHRFKKLCKAEEIRVAEIDAPSVPRNKILSLLLENISNERADVLSIVDLSHESRERRLALYDALNFQRDAILSLRKPVLLWLTVEETFEIAKSAPDFWSRRTAVYHFDETPAQALIAKLFRNSPIPRETFVSDAPLSECLEIILQKEKQLQVHVNPKSELDISRAKECQQRLIAAADQLLAAIEDGKALELTLWLWNLSNLDSTLQEWLSKLNRRDRDRLESMYSDRNEVLLALAGDLARITKRYKARIKRNLGKLRPASLLELFRDRADVYLDETARQLASLSKDEPSSDRRDYGADIDPAYVYDLRRTDSEVAAQDLEGWLAGDTWKRPGYLSEEEGNLLKDLYHRRPVLGQAMKFGASERQVLGKVEDLHKKLRVRLGVSSRRTNKQKTPAAGLAETQPIGSDVRPMRSRDRS